MVSGFNMDPSAWCLGVMVRKGGAVAGWDDRYHLVSNLLVMTCYVFWWSMIFKVYPRVSRIDLRG